jgi:hypothetical protein
MKLSFIEKLEQKLRKLVRGTQRAPDRIWLRPRQQVGEIRSQGGGCMCPTRLHGVTVLKTIT